MIKAILFDLDGTLIRTDSQAIFAHSMRLISSYMTDLATPESFVAQAFDARHNSRNNLDPTATIGEVFYNELHAQLGCPPNSLVPVFQRFYESGQDEQRISVWPQPGASDLLAWLISNGYRVVLAGDATMHRQTAQRLMQLGSLSPEAASLETLTGLDVSHFSKPHPHYYQELLANLDVRPDEALMVGHDWQADVQSAASAGLNTFWVTEEPARRHTEAMAFTPDGQGSLETLMQLAVNQGWLAALEPRDVGASAHSASLLGTLAAIDNLLRKTDAPLWTRHPEGGEWSARDALCHLRDHEIEVDQPRLRQILDEDNPFISATGYDPLAHMHNYLDEDPQSAFQDFVDRRRDTIAILDDLDAAAWARPARHSIFGPTTLEELVRFMADHDRIHLRQMRDALAVAHQPAV